MAELVEVIAPILREPYRASSLVEAINSVLRPWLEAHKHNDAIDKLMGKMRKLEWQLRETREDNAMDDRAQRTRNPFQDKTA